MEMKKTFTSSVVMFAVVFFSGNITVQAQSKSSHSHNHAVQMELPFQAEGSNICIPEILLEDIHYRNMSAATNCLIDSFYYSFYVNSEEQRAYYTYNAMNNLSILLTQQLSNGSTVLGKL